MLRWACGRYLAQITLQNRGGPPTASACRIPFAVRPGPATRTRLTRMMHDLDEAKGPMTGGRRIAETRTDQLTSFLCTWPELALHAPFYVPESFPVSNKADFRRRGGHSLPNLGSALQQQCT